MWSSNIFWALIFLITKHYAAGGMLDAGVKEVQKTYTKEREDLKEKTTKIKNDLYELLCKKDEKYRSIDGTCNNMCDDQKKCHLGAAGTEYTRYFKENSYCDGEEEFPCTDSNDCLTSAREMTLKLYDEKKKKDENYTLLTVPFGQFVVHDLAFAYIGSLINCCDNGKYTSNEKTHPKCASIAVPECDPVFGPAGFECRNFVRSDTGSCKPKVPVNRVTHYLDLSQVYGSDYATMKTLRTFKGGRLQSKKKCGKEWLPQSMNPMETCFNLTCSEDPCYRAGDVRVNQNTELTLLHTIFMRFHNFVARILCGKKQCQWSDEKCFQEARRICIAVYQNIVFNEYLPIILGKEYMEKKKLIYKKSCRDEDGYVNDYSCDCDPSMSVECASAAWRGQHSAIPGMFKLYSEREDCKDKKRCNVDYFAETGAIELSGWMNKPEVLEKGDNSIGLSRGLFAQCQEGVDRHMDAEIFHRIFRAQEPVGNDLLALDVQRARDHGLANYCDAAIACGKLTKCTCFEDLCKCIPKKHVRLLKKVYDKVENVELMTGGMLERLECGARTGPVFRCIIGKQFKNVRCADSFWYERSDQVYPFTPDQLCNIREIPMATLICLFGDGVDKIQNEAFKKISKENPVKDCCDLPTLDFSLFQICDDKK